MQQIENTIVKEPAATYNIPYQDTLSQREKIPGIERFIKLWKEKVEKHEREDKAAEGRRRSD